MKDLKIINGGIINKGEISEKLGVRAWTEPLRTISQPVRYALQ